MADQINKGQFGQREDTIEQASKGGRKSTGSFGSKNGANPSQAGKAGAQAQSTEAKAKGGRNSRRGDL